jgi:hypothetical protein
MFHYRNTRTGATIVVPCPIGGEWELIKWESTDEEKQPGAEPKKPVKKTAKKTTKK